MKNVLLLVRLLFFCCMAVLIFVQCKRDEPVKNSDPEPETIHDPLTISLNEAREVASFPAKASSRINADSSAATLSRVDEITDQLAITDSADGSPLLYIFKKEKGFAIISADLRVMPILAFSESSDIDVNNIPNGVSLWLDMAKTKVREARNKGGEPHPIVRKEGQKYLSRKLRIEDSNCIEWYQYGQFQCKNKMTIKGPLISTIWGQTQLSTTKLSTAGDCDGCGRRVAGCGPVAMAQLEEYYHPNLSRPRVSEGKCAASNAGEHSLGTLMKTMGDKAKASYNYMGSCNTFTWPADVKSGLKSFGFSSGGSANEAYNLALIESELNTNHPLLFWGSTCLSCFNDYHIWACEGYQLSEYSEFDCATKTCKEWSYTYLRMNWGWGGKANGDYAFGQYNPKGEDYNGNLHVITGIRP
ncbi:Spi family protease inhibitor [Dyadobacter psychrophilus]|uniref:Peptidase C10 family protein n=1 Tax=Dyadobacter psychrophilus TaxID=651661 RepID=A0A1T5BCJ9_9BACT|nr:Spi family protease inhibitor [Dyadobacter psychrophilus]SKB44885.1 Peptidase C10 family protein [Dyadobacter psychrophilus]